MITAKAAAAAAGPANGTSAATTTAERAEHGTRVTRNDASTRSRRVASTRVPYTAGTLQPVAARSGIAVRPDRPRPPRMRSVRTASEVR